MPVAVPTTNRVRWHRRIEAAVVAGSSLLVAISIGAVLVATTRLITTRALDLASADMEAARAAFYHIVDRQGDSAAAQARMVTALPVFRAHMDDPSDPARNPRLAADRATIEAMAEEYRQQLRAEFCIVTSRGEDWLGSPGWPGHGETPQAVRRLIASALEGRSGRDLVLVDNRLYLVVSEPARFAEETLGTLTAGYALDDRFAEDLATATRAEVTFEAGGRVSGTSAPPAVRVALDEALRTGQGLLAASPGAEGAGGPGGPEVSGVPGVIVRRLGDAAYVVATSSLFPGRPSAELGSLVLLQDWQPTQQFLDEVRWSLGLIGVAIFALALVGGVVFGRRVSRPLRDISDAARDIASGNWNREVPIRGRAEATTMAEAFNEMTATVRHWYEEAKDQSAQLQASNDRFRAVTESARDAIVSIDRRGAVAFWNRSAGLIFSCDEAAALGKPFAGFIDPVDRPRYLGAIGSGDVPSPTIELTGVRQDGSRVPIELLLSPPVGEDSSVTAVVRDITDRRQAEAVLRQRDEELRQAQKLEAVGRLAGGVAHDFNNLLTAIIGFAELVRRAIPDKPEHLEDVDEILNAANRAAQLTRQMLAFSRRQVLAPRVIALDQILLGTEKMLRRLIGEDIALTCDSEPALGLVKADPGQIEQVVLNLAVNARDAMPNGGELTMSLANVELDDRAASEFEGLTRGRYVRLDVIDNGTGMDADTVSKIFEPFFTTKEEGKGTGLGLATVYGIVRQSGGAIDVQSRLGQGTRFRILLPRCEGQADAPSQSPAAPSARRSESLLLVEDDEVVRRLLGLMLRQQGYTVLEAAGAHAALALSRATAGPIHLLLTDVVMPQMNGRRLAELLKLERAEMRVLFMSGYSDDAVLRAGVQMRETPFIQKPFSAEDLEAKIRETLG